MKELIDLSDNTTDPITFELIDEPPMPYIHKGVRRMGYEATITGPRRFKRDRLQELVGQHIPGVGAPIVGVESYCVGHYSAGSPVVLSVVTPTFPPEKI